MTIDVVAAIIRRDGKILITKRLKDVHLAGLWEFPGGKVETGESLAVALQREIQEELGIQIEVHDEFFTTEHDYPGKSIRLHFFNCAIVAGEPQLLAVSDFQWVASFELDDFEFPPADLELIRRLAAN